jgi:anti-anti-sigma factor
MGGQRNLTSGSHNPEVDMPQTLPIQDSAASSGDAPPQAVVRSWQDPGSAVAWVQVAGELDIATAPALEHALRDAEPRARLVVLDLRELAFTDTCGVHVISQASINARRAGRRLILVRGPTQADRLFALTTPDVLEIVDLDPGEPVAHALEQLRPGPGCVNAPGVATDAAELTAAISAAMVELHGAFYGQGHMTATTYINDKIVACVLKNTPMHGQDIIAADGAGGEAIEDRVGFDTETEDEFCAAVERLTHRRVVAFMSQQQTTPGVACELFFLNAVPLAGPGRSSQLGAAASDQGAS